MRLLGTWITQSDISFSENLSDFSFDWLCIDMEHSTISYEQMKNHIISINSKGKEAFVRVGKNDSLEIKRALDAGADGIIVPMINSYEEALLAVDSCFYPPIGKRGFGLTRANSFGDKFENYTKNTSLSVKLIVQIEHKNAIKDLEKILSHDMIDGSMIGPYDLSGSLNKPGKFNDKEVQHYLNEYLEIAKRFDKKIGYHLITDNPKELTTIFEKGYDFVALNFDIYYLRLAIKNLLKDSS